MTPATSVTFFRPEFGDFLYTSIRADSDDMPLSVLSALARLDMDPWKEAAELTELSADAAAVSVDDSQGENRSIDSGRDTTDDSGSCHSSSGQG